MVLALAYIPTHITLISVGKKISELIFPVPPINEELWPKWLKNRINIEDIQVGLKNAVYLHI